MANKKYGQKRPTMADVAVWARAMVNDYGVVVAWRLEPLRTDQHNSLTCNVVCEVVESPSERAYKNLRIRQPYPVKGAASLEGVLIVTMMKLDFMIMAVQAELRERTTQL